MEKKKVFFYHLEVFQLENENKKSFKNWKRNPIRKWKKNAFKNWK